MIKIMMISDMDRFLEKVAHCYGDVLLHLPDGTTCSLKNDHTALQILKMLNSTHETFNISLTDVRDYSTIINLMMDAAA